MQTATNMQQTAADLDFDFQMPCRYFKSSFARSLSLNNNNGNGNNNSLTLPKKPQTNEAKQQQQLQQTRQQQNKEDSLEGDSESESPCATPPPALPARRHTSTLTPTSASASASANMMMIHFGAANQQQHQQQQLTPQQQQQPQQQLTPQQSGRNLNLVWPMQQPHQQQQDANIIGAAPSHSHHIYDLPQQFHPQPQPQHHQTQHQHQHHQPPQQQQQHQLNVEAVILQNQVDTLHWQLKQTETNCEMYRAVMEEVARFFERYQQLQQLQQTQRNGEQIARSKSLHHVHGVGNTSVQSEPRDDDASSATGSASYLRARSSTNLMLNKSMHAMNEEHNYETIAPAGSYNAFKDFTWRRSPKKYGASGGCKARLSAPEVAEEKLNQEAFRLARTIRNLLHTSQQQPDLTQPRHSICSLPGGGNHRLCKGKICSVPTMCTPPLLNSTSIMNATMEVASSPAGKSNAELIFLRANNMRDSRLSLRSSTDSSVHSTISSTASSSSKVEETDEEIQSNNNNNTTTTTASNTAINNKPTSNKQSGSSTEDESGFSSISSFHDVGLPLSSTLMNGSQRRLSMSSDSRNSTLKSGLNVVGLPLQTQNEIQVQAQISASQSPSKTYRNANRYQRFSTLSNEDAAAVLWV